MITPTDRIAAATAETRRLHAAFAGLCSPASRHIASYWQPRARVVPLATVADYIRNAEREVRRLVLLYAPSPKYRNVGMPYQWTERDIVDGLSILCTDAALWFSIRFEPPVVEDANAERHG